MTTEGLVEVIERLPDHVLIGELVERGYIVVSKQDEDDD